MGEGSRAGPHATLTIGGARLLSSSPHPAHTTAVDPFTLDAARQGDRAARGKLLTSLQDVWYRFCLAQLHDADLAADATQETGLRFLRQLNQFRGESQLQTWSLGIALNVVREL